ncbi:Uncharacterized protein PBTT_06656 [Plasmodiophora brassicae]
MEPDDAVMRRALDDFQAEASAQIEGQVRCGTAGSAEVARDQIVHALLHHRTSSPINVTEDALRSLMVRGHLHRHEAIRALLLDRELRALSCSTPADSVAALTARLRSRKKQGDVSEDTTASKKRRSCSPEATAVAPRPKRFRAHREFDLQRRRVKPSKAKSTSR